MSFGNEREFIDHLQSKEKEGRAMKCPLFWMHWLDKESKMDIEDTDCLKEACAWWDSVGQRCVSLSIYQELRLLVGACAPIADLVPPARR